MCAPVCVCVQAYLAPRPGAAPPPAPLRLPSAHLPRFYYEGVAYHRPPDGGPVLLRGWYQVEAEFEADARRIHLDVSYEPKAGRSMPKYKHRMELEWEAQGAGGVLQLGEVKQGKYWGRWTGEAVGGEGGELQLTEEEDFIVLR